MAKKKNIEISTGKDYESEKKMLKEEVSTASVNPKTLDEIWGFKKKTKFPANTEDEYRKYLGGLNKSDLREECFKNEILPRDTREMMTASLVKEFKSYRACLATAHIQAQNTVVMTPELQRLLNPRG